MWMGFLMNDLIHSYIVFENRYNKFCFYKVIIVKDLFGCKGILLWLQKITVHGLIFHRNTLHLVEPGA